MGGEDEDRRRISTIGIRKARVFPEPVAASTATSLKLHSRGIVAAWTGVQNLKPACDNASRTVSERGGFRSEKRVTVNALPGFCVLESIAVSQLNLPPLSILLTNLLIESELLWGKVVFQ